MSENAKVRYFQRKGRTVGWADNPTAVASFVRDEWTEVQVVPLDAIVIRREGAEVVPYSEHYVRIGGEKFHSGVPDEWYEKMARSYALLAEYLREHPPVDEEQVKALTSVIDEDEAWGEDGSSATLARRLVQRGVRVEAT